MLRSNIVMMSESEFETGGFYFEAESHLESGGGYINDFDFGGVRLRKTQNEDTWGGNQCKCSERF